MWWWTLMWDLGDKKKKGCVLISDVYVSSWQGVNCVSFYFNLTQARGTWEEEPQFRNASIRWGYRETVGHFPPPPPNVMSVLPACVCVPYACLVLQRSEEGLRSPASEGCELPRGCLELNPGPCKSNKCSQPFNHWANSTAPVGHFLS